MRKEKYKEAIFVIRLLLESDENNLLYNLIAYFLT